MSATEEAVEQATTILRNRRGVDPIQTDRAERIEELTRTIAEKTLPDDGETTLRNWLEPLDLHFDPEDYIEHDPPIAVTPEVIAVTVYINEYPKTMGAGTHDKIHRKYIEPYTEMTEDEHFNMTEYVGQYYD